MKVKCDHRSKFSNLSNWKEEAWKKSGLQRLDNPMGLTDSAIYNLIFRNASARTAERNADDRGTVRISFPFKDQVAPDAVRK